MINIQPNVSLKDYNTFGVDVKATHFVETSNPNELKEALASKINPKFILGGGSNMLLQNDINALVIYVNHKGIKVVNEDEDHIWLEVAAGENWHQFVRYCVTHNFGGVENLSLIPGNTGTAPIQNIGAYGVELKDIFDRCTAINRNTLETETFTLSQCEFGYRDSIFKGKVKNQYVITSVTFKLTKRNHQLNTSYGAIQQVLNDNGIEQPALKDISDAVIQIRQQKLPDPKLLGNSGSFFKNPVVSQDFFNNIYQDYPNMPHYPVTEKQVKIPAGWLIEQAGLKGKRFGNAGVHTMQALVIVNYGKATGAEIWEVALQVQQAVHDKFGILLQPEVNIIS